MTPERFERARELFEQAQPLPASEQPAFLAKHCGGDTELLLIVDELMRRARAQHAERADCPDAWDGETGTAEPPAPGKLPPIAHEGYEIVRELHRGGQGIVYQAVQKTTKRKLAIKVLLEGPYASEKANHDQRKTLRDGAPVLRS